MKYLVLLILLSNSIICAQNLVPNHSFEESHNTIGGFTDNAAEFNASMKFWESPNLASPDLISPGFSEGMIEQPFPRSGSNMIGIQAELDWGEYVGTSLKESLVPNKTYKIEYWIRRSFSKMKSRNYNQRMNKNFGILLTNEHIYKSKKGLIVADPQIASDSTVLITDEKWVKISDYITPKEEYNHLYIGQFSSGSDIPKIMIGYFVIDDISVTEISDFSSIDPSIVLPIGSIIPLDEIYFESGTTNLKNAKSISVLEELYKYLVINSSIRICINGHTDSRGTKKSNLSLSQRRAQVIAKKIIEYGVSVDRIEWIGYGEKEPVASNDNPEGRSKNRRVEFEIIE